MRIEIFLSGVGDEDTLARRIVQDARQSDEILDADILRRPAEPGERGIIEEVGAVAVTLLTTGGAEFLFSLLRNALSVGRAQMNDARSVRIKTPNGHEVELSGAMSDREFRAICDRTIRLLESKANGEKT